MSKKVKIYTKTGDGGETGLWGGQRVSKDNIRLHAYGSVDECNASIGAARLYLGGSELDGWLDQIQNKLFVVGADLATPGGTKTVINRVGEEEVIELEGWIDTLEAVLPELKQFILPGGGEAAARLHLARTVCRRAERWTATLLKEDASAGMALKYLNRLSDFLFVAARSANKLAGAKDIVWRQKRSQRDQ